MNVVLTAQRIDAAAFNTDIAAKHGQVSRALDIVRTGNMLGNAHRVNNAGAVRPGIHARGFLQIFSGNTGNFFDLFRCVFFNNLLERFESFGSLFHIVPGIKPFVNNHIHQAVEHSDISTRILAQPDVAVFDQIDFPRINNNQFRAAFGRALDLGADYGMIFCRVGTYG